MFKKCFTDKIKKKQSDYFKFKGRNTFAKNQNLISMHKLKKSTTAKSTYLSDGAV